MKVFKKILIILGLIIFILSISLSIMLAMSTTYGMVLKDNPNARKKIVSKTEQSIDDKFYVSYKNIKDSEGSYVQGQIACVVLEDDFDCKMIEKEYDKSNALVRTNYMPGDDFKYVLEGENKSKTTYYDADIQNEATIKVSKFIVDLRLLLQENDEKYDYDIDFKTKLKLDFSNFELDKIINVTTTHAEKVETKIMEVNGQDCVEKIIYDDGGYIEFKGQALVLNFPSFEDYK